MRLPSILGILTTTTLFRSTTIAASTTTTFSTRNLNLLAFTPPSITKTNTHHPLPSTIPKMSTSSSDHPKSKNLYLATPLLHSTPLSTLCSRPIYLKLDSLQPSGSFKDRGMAHLCTTLQSTKNTSKLISSSGGNAGLAVATVGKKLNMDVQVIVPQTTKALVIEKLKALGADVTVHGVNWNEADLLARRRVSEDTEAEYVSPYDDALLWTGHSTVVDEIVNDLKGQEEKEIGAVIASVGGGGLLCGIFEGVSRHGDTLNKACIVAAETEGAASFGGAWNNAKDTSFKLKGIDSIATSLGALQVTPVAIERATNHEKNGGVVKTAICTDAEAVEACVKFASDHRILVEPACGAALAALYSDRVRGQVLEGVEGAVVVEVCGGSGVNTELLEQWKKDFFPVEETTKDEPL